MQRQVRRQKTVRCAALHDLAASHNHDLVVAMNMVEAVQYGNNYLLPTLGIDDALNIGFGLFVNATPAN